MFTVLPKLGVVGNSAIMNVEPVFALASPGSSSASRSRRSQIARSALVVVATVVWLGCAAAPCTRRRAPFVARSLRARVASGRKQPPPHHMLSAYSSRPISMRRISLVPAPISYSLASRQRRPTGYSLV